MTATMEREPAEDRAGQRGACADGGVSGGANAGGSLNAGGGTSTGGACAGDNENGCSVDESFRKAARSKAGAQMGGDGDVSGRMFRRKVIEKGKVAIIAALALTWLTELGGEALSNYERSMRKEFVCDSMLWDLQRGGTAIGVYPSSRADIQSRWGAVAQDDERQWHDEDCAKAFNWIMLMALSVGLAFLFMAPQGKKVLAEYIEKGLPDKVVPQL